MMVPANGQAPMMVVYMPSNAGGHQGYWMPDQMSGMGQVTNASFGGADMSGMQQQTGPNSWNWGQEASNQQFGNQPQHQSAQQDFSAWGHGPQHQGGMQEQSQQMWAPQGGQPHQQHQHQQQPMMGNAGQQQPMMGNAGQQQMMGNSGPQQMMGNSGQQPMMGNQGQQPMMGNAGQQPMMGNTGQQPMMGNTVQQQPMMGNANMGGMMPQDNSGYYNFTPAQSQASPPMQTTSDKTAPQSQTAMSPAAATQATTQARPQTKKRGLRNLKIGKDGSTDPNSAKDMPPVEKAAPHERRYLDGESLSQHEFCEQLGDEHGMHRWSQAKEAPSEPLAPIPFPPKAPPECPSSRANMISSSSTGTSDSRSSMIKALNLQPISAPNPNAAKARTAAQRGKEAPMDRCQEIQALKDFAEAQKKKANPSGVTDDTPAPQPPVIKEEPPQQLQQLQQQAQQPAPTPGPTASSAQRKGRKLVNISLDRDGVTTAPRPAGPAITPAPETSGDSKEDSAKDNSLVPASEDPMTKRRREQFHQKVLLGRTNGFDRTMMLQFWNANKAVRNDLGYRTAERDGSSASPANWDRMPRKQDKRVDDSSWRSQGGKSKDKKPMNDVKQALKPSANAYKIVKAQTRDAELEKSTRSLLNKICPENRDKIIDRLAATDIQTKEEMEIVINIIFQKVTDDPHYCGTYVDMISRMQKAYPEFPPQEEGQQPCTFRRMLVNTCQDKFEDMLASSPDGQDEDTSAGMDEEEIKEKKMKMKNRNMATMKFIGHLFLRQLLAAAVIRQVMFDLLGSQDLFPTETHVEYALELLIVVGPRFEETDKDKAQLNTIMDRLTVVKASKGPDGKQILSKRVGFIIQDAKDLRHNGWKGRGFKEEAKTKDEVATEQRIEEHQQGGGNKGRGGGGGYRNR